MDITTQNENNIRHALDFKVWIDSIKNNAANFYCNGRSYAQWRSEFQPLIFKPEKDEQTGEITWPGIPEDYIPVEAGVTDESGIINLTEDLYFRLSASEQPMKNYTLHIVTESGFYKPCYGQVSLILGSSAPSGYNAAISLFNGSWVNWPKNEKVYITRVVGGSSFEVTNENLISCNLDLRGFTTTEDNPTFQGSEINIEFLAPSDAGMMVACLEENMILRYIAGYFPDDVSEVRTFYSRTNPTSDGNSITFKGEDATSYFDEKLDKVRGITNSDPANDIFQILLNDVINSTSLGPICTDTTPPPTVSPTGTYTPETTYHRITDRKKFISQIMNVFTPNLRAGDGRIYFKYVDAGRPKLTTTQSPWSDAINLDWRHIGDIKYDYEQVVKNTRYTPESWTRKDSQEYKSIDKRTISGIVPYMVHTSEPVFEAKLVLAGTDTPAGRVTILDGSTVQAYKTVTGEREVEILAKVYTEDENDIVSATKDLLYPFTNGGKTVNLSDDVPKLKLGNNDITEAGIKQMRSDIWSGNLATYIGTTTFTWKGNPNLQPMDKLLLLNKTTMQEDTYTIEHININHTGGGMICEVKARKGDF